MLGSFSAAVDGHAEERFPGRGRGRGEVAVTNRRQRHDAQVEGVHGVAERGLEVVEDRGADQAQREGDHLDAVGINHVVFVWLFV